VAAQVIDGGVRFEGNLTETFVVAGLVEETTGTYRLELRSEPCRDRRGRVQPTSVRIEYRPDYARTGCGGPLPLSWPAPTSG
jgi:hypothetical protein